MFTFITLFFIYLLKYLIEDVFEKCQTTFTSNILSLLVSLTILKLLKYKFSIDTVFNYTNVIIFLFINSCYVFEVNLI